MSAAASTLCNSWAKQAKKEANKSLSSRKSSICFWLQLPQKSIPESGSKVCPAQHLMENLNLPLHFSQRTSDKFVLQPKVFSLKI